MISKKSCFIFLGLFFCFLGNTQPNLCAPEPFCAGWLSTNYGSYSNPNYYYCKFTSGYVPSNMYLQISYGPEYGVPPYTFQWQGAYAGTNWVNLPGETGTILSNVLFRSYTMFRIRTTDSTGAVASSPTFSINTCNIIGGSIGMRSPLATYNGDNVVIPVGYAVPTIVSYSDGSPPIYGYPNQYEWFKANGSYATPIDSFKSIGYGGSNFLVITPPKGTTPSTYSYKRFLHNYDCFCPYDVSSYTNTFVVAYVSSNPYYAGDLIPNVASATIGNTIHFNASTPATGGVDPYAYQWQDSIPGSIGWFDIFGATNETYSTAVNQHKFYRRRAWDMVNKISFTTPVFMRPSSSINIFTSTNVNSFQIETQPGNYWFDIIDTANNVIASVNPGNNNLGTVTLKFKHYGTGAANVPVSNTGITYMPRYFELSSSAYPDGNIPNTVSVRLYNTNTELTDFKAKIGNNAVSTANLRIAHYHGSIHDCDMNNNTSGTTTEITPSNLPFATSFANGFYLQFNTNKFSEFGIVSNLGPLPVTWMNFTGALKEKNIQLNWSVANQQNNKGFEIQRSSNGTNFQSIGFVHATVANNYSFTDIAPLANVNHYRLRQVDINGDATYSNTITIKSNSKNQFTVFPNPVKDYFIVQAATNKNIQYVIVNANGQTILKGITNNGKQIDVSQLPKGTYALQLFVDNDKQVFKVVRL